MPYAHSVFLKQKGNGEDSVSSLKSSRPSKFNSIYSTRELFYEQCISEDTSET